MNDREATIKNLQDIREHLVKAYGNDVMFSDELDHLVKILDARIRDFRVFGPEPRHKPSKAEQAFIKLMINGKLAELNKPTIPTVFLRLFGSGKSGPVEIGIQRGKKGG